MQRGEACIGDQASELLALSNGQKPVKVVAHDRFGRPPCHHCSFCGIEKFEPLRVKGTNEPLELSSWTPRHAY